jgi:hypothetical protein
MAVLTFWKWFGGFDSKGVCAHPLNAVLLQQDYTTLYPRRLSPSVIWLWRPSVTLSSRSSLSIKQVKHLVEIKRLPCKVARSLAFECLLELTCHSFGLSVCGGCGSVLVWSSSHLQTSVCVRAAAERSYKCFFPPCIIAGWAELDSIGT